MKELKANVNFLNIIIFHPNESTVHFLFYNSEGEQTNKKQVQH